MNNVHYHIKTITSMVLTMSVLIVLVQGHFPATIFMMSADTTGPDVLGGEYRSVMSSSTEKTRKGQDYDSESGGKWVYGFDEAYDLVVLQNIDIIDGKGVLRSRQKLDNFSYMDTSDMMDTWESSGSGGSFELDNSEYNVAPGSGHFTSTAGTGSYSVTRPIPSLGSSDLLELNLSINVHDVTEGTSNDGMWIRLHFTGSDDGVEYRIHEDGSMGTYGWDVSQNTETSIPLVSLSSDTWYEIGIEVNMTSQTSKLVVDGTEYSSGDPFRSDGGGSVLFIDSFTLGCGSGQDSAECHLDDMYATKNTIDSGVFRSPTVSKGTEMEWQHLMVKAGDHADQLSLTLIDMVTSDHLPGYDGINIPGDGKVDLSLMSDDVSHFKVEVLFERDHEKRPSLDYIAVSWGDRNMSFNPLFAGTGLQITGLDIVDHGVMLKEYSPGNYRTTGTVVTPAFQIPTNRVWLRVTTEADIPAGHNLTLVVLPPTGNTPLEGIPPSYNGSIELDILDPSKHGSIRISATLKADGSSTPLLKWISISTEKNTWPVVTSIDPAADIVYRMESLNISVEYSDLTDPWEDLVVELHYKRTSAVEWSEDMVEGPLFNGSDIWFHFDPTSTAEVGEYQFKLSVTDRLGESTEEISPPIEVINKKVSKPMATISPTPAFTTNLLQVQIVEPSMDPEGETVKYRYHWYVNSLLVDPDNIGQPEEGWNPANSSSTVSTLSAAFTTKGDNVSCMIVPTDLVEDGPAFTVWVNINNSPPEGPENILPYVMEEDTPILINLTENFTDPDGDDLEFDISSSANVEIEDLLKGMVKVIPVDDLNGEVTLNVTASDGLSEFKGRISITYTPVNDPPTIIHIGSKTIYQGDSLDIPVECSDPESPCGELRIDVTLPDTWGDHGTCQWIDNESIIRIVADNLNVGDHTFEISAMDPEGLETVLVFNITVENVDDPLESVIIISPEEGQSYPVAESIQFEGEGMDPDLVHGQELDFKWYVGTDIIGYERVMEHSFDETGTYKITFEVSDGEKAMTTSVSINITSQDGGGGGGGTGVDDEEEDNGFSTLLIAVSGAALLLLILVIAFIMFSKKKGKKDGSSEIPTLEDKSEEKGSGTASEIQGSPPSIPKETVEEVPGMQEPPKQRDSVPEPAQEKKHTAPPPQPQAESEIQIPDGDDLLMPDEGTAGLSIPDIDMPEAPAPSGVDGSEEEEEMEGDSSNIEYYSPNK